uniref:E3 ubiquitin-protein ligase HERC4 n=1 Tax=Hirondellea gigas TaxID=1518452 RepID=A0A2P2HWL3_9CRUS
MSACISRAGFLVTWGSNRQGQLGRIIKPEQLPYSTNARLDNSSLPHVVQQLANYSVPIVHVSAGSNHVAVLDAQGKLWTYGGNGGGALGHGGTCTEGSFNDRPTPVSDFVGSRVTQVECGRSHNLAVVKGQVYCFGNGSSGQLGVATLPPRGYISSPRLVDATWMSDADAGVPSTTDFDSTATSACGGSAATTHVKEVFCGSDCSFLAVSCDVALCVDRSLWPRLPAPVPVSAAADEDADKCETMDTSESLASGCEAGGPSYALVSDENEDTEANGLRKRKRSLERMEVNESVAVARCPFLPVYELQLEHLQYMAHLKQDCIVDGQIFSYLETAIGSVQCWNQSFLSEMENRNTDHHYIDLNLVYKYMTLMRTITRDTAKDMFLQGLDCVVGDLPQDFVTKECLRCFILLCLTPQFAVPENYSMLHIAYAVKIMNIRKPSLNILRDWFKSLPLQEWNQVVVCFVTAARYKLRCSRGGETSMSSETEVFFLLLEFLYKTNKTRESGVKPEVFYVPEIYDKVQLAMDYINYRNSRTLPQQQSQVFFCSFPFLFDAKCKCLVLRCSTIMQMRRAMSIETMANNYFGGPFEIFLRSLQLQEVCLKLNIRRDYMINDTLLALQQSSTNDLKLPINVSFVGEVAQDDGGVRKEFFLLLMRDILNPNFGMFKEYETNCIWFAEETFETDQMYCLVGTLCGLAIYNNVIINLPFPLPLYKKLLDEPITLDDLATLEPTMTRGMREMLSYEGDVEMDLMLNFVITRKEFDTPVDKALKPDGENIPVNNENRKEYVDLVVDFIFNTSISQQYNAFKEGFQKVCDSEILCFFQPLELMGLVAGNEDYDWGEFKKNATYKGVYSATHETIVMFWQVFLELPLEDKKKFLMFLTGCDRAPIQGIGSIIIVVVPVHNTNLLPVAHTCMNQLDLPLYCTKERLRYKLTLAIRHSEGFGIV